MGLDQFKPPYSVHVGCNTMRIEGFVNVDARSTEAADVIHDCKDLCFLPDASTKLVFAHAFIEHLYRDQRVPFLADVHRALQDGGEVFVMGIPDFETVAHGYLTRRVGNTSPLFDLFEVYRYTHGNPEHQTAWWQEQLHKSLFDQHELRVILGQAGFKAPAILRYAYKSEPNSVNLGFVATKANTPCSEDRVRQLYGMFSPIYGANPFVLV